MELDIIKIQELTNEAATIEDEIRETERRKLKLIDEIDSQIKSLKTKEYRISSKLKKLFPEEFWTCEIDKHWHKPLHYKIKNISYYGDTVYITTQDIRKKKPYDGWKGVDEIMLDKFMKIGLYDSYDTALKGFVERPCPRCGNFMHTSTFPWCRKCMDTYQEYLNANEQLYYDAKQQRVYGVQPDIDQEVYRNFWKGYDGISFKIRRLDTGEIIETHNLWSRGFGENNENYPLIEFIGKDDKIIDGPRPTICG